MFIFALAAALAVATGLAAGRRAARAERAFPPTGTFLTVAGRRVHYRQAGAGPDVILLHGASGSIREFDFGLMQALAAKYRVTAFDRPGLGYSDPIADDSLAGQARHLAAAAEALGIARPLILGQSFGGSVALAWALQGGPSALVLLGAPAIPWPGDLDIWYRLNRPWPLRWLMPWLAAAWIWPGYIRASLEGIFAPNPVPPGYAEGIGTDLTIRPYTLRANVAQVNALRAQLVAMEPQYHRLSLPVEVIHGKDDTVVPYAVHPEVLCRHLPDAHLTALPRTGHMPHHVHLGEVMAAIDRAHSRANSQGKQGVHHGPAL